MSLRKVQARFIADEEVTGSVRAVEVFGLVLTESFSKIEVEDPVLAKLQGNPHIEVKGVHPLDGDNDGKAGGSKPRKPADETAPAAPPAVEPDAA